MGEGGALGDVPVVQARPEYMFSGLLSVFVSRLLNYFINSCRHIRFKNSVEEITTDFYLFLWGFCLLTIILGQMGLAVNPFS